MDYVFDIWQREIRADDTGYLKIALTEQQTNGLAASMHPIQIRRKYTAYRKKTHFQF